MNTPTIENHYFNLQGFLHYPLFHLVGFFLLSMFFLSCNNKTISYHSGQYKGELQNGIPNGYGIFKKNNLIYEGSWKNGVPDGFGKYEHGDTCYEGQYSQGARCGEGHFSIKKTLETYDGLWNNNKREGQGTLTDSTGRKWTGIWEKDKLTSGTLTDSLGIYTGTFNDTLQPSGFGKFISHDRLSSYEGHWNQGKHNGFGFNAQSGRSIQCGWWKKGFFLGEKMLYTSSRVYGIDISKYQHRPERWIRVKHRRHRIKVGTPINWKKLRIIHLGGSHNKNVVGQINYPISFCYIKSTQGISIKNSYYWGDARGARNVGIKVGAYHFMSPLAGAPQARWFLKNSDVLRSDLPPMLDVELTAKQIKKMGGKYVMFRETLQWLHIVQQATGHKPILYVSQHFIDFYLPHAPKEFLNYHVWIARYGEYRPYVKLLYWQLSPYGGVRGINGHVDINVFNGSKEQFSRYIESGYTDLP